ncbi:serine hydrolase domain-containing protein [Stigmatella aurantiaca]|uniref:serine hydrolase domain-containing protein n=1 Tax=Stigmatella aurantiaca TaxID=41 RepID=UPI0009443E85|nr:serine hydrolase domain-containing protein [Stigmatella aurantiaca]
MREPPWPEGGGPLGRLEGREHSRALGGGHGWLDDDAPVASYWAEFAQAGKSRITVHQLLAHKTGLPAFDGWMEPVKLAGLDSLARGLAWQAPAWEPGTHHGDPSFTSG